MPFRRTDKIVVPLYCSNGNLRLPVLYRLGHLRKYQSRDFKINDRRLSDGCVKAVHRGVSVSFTHLFHALIFFAQQDYCGNLTVWLCRHDTLRIGSLASRGLRATVVSSIILPLKYRRGHAKLLTGCN